MISTCNQPIIIHLSQFLQAVCGLTTAKVVYLIPQTYMSLYFLDTLNMDKVSGKETYTQVLGSIQLFFIHNRRALQ